MSTTPAALTALNVLPDLVSIGFVRQTAEKMPAPSGLDIAFAVYQGSGAAPLTARAEVRVYPSEAIAHQDFAAQAEGWRRPPPGVFGGDLANADAPALPGLDDARAYLSGKSDAQGNRVWTDVYRVGRVIVVAHVLGKDETAAAPVRNTVAVSIKAKVQ